MRILVIGTGGVGSAFAGIAAATRLLLALCPGRLRPVAAPGAVVGRLDDGTLLGSAASTRATSRDDRAPDRRDACRRGAQQRRPALQRADLRRVPRRGRDLPRHGDDAVGAPPDEPYAGDAASKLGDDQFARADAWETAGPARARRHRRRARLPPTSSRAMPPTSCSRRSTRSGCATAPNLVVDGYDFAPTFSIWTTIEECLNPPVIWERERGWFTTQPFSEPEVFDFPGGHRPGRVRQRRARGGAARPALGGLPARDVQVRPRRRVHRRAEDAPQARARRDGAGRRCGASRWRRATSSRPRCPTRRRSATAWAARRAPGTS